MTNQKAIMEGPVDRGGNPMGPRPGPAPIPAQMPRQIHEEDKTLQVMLGIRPVKGGFICEHVVVQPSPLGVETKRESDMAIVAGKMNQATENRIIKEMRLVIEDAVKKAFGTLILMDE